MVRGLRAPLYVQALKKKDGQKLDSLRASEYISLWLWHECFKFYHTNCETDGAGHDIINNFIFLCISMKNLISISNFSNIVMKNVQ